MLEIIGKKGYVQVNGKAYVEKSIIFINGGDEIIFSSKTKQAYVSYCLWCSDSSFFIILFMVVGRNTLLYLFISLTYY